MAEIVLVRDQVAEAAEWTSGQRPLSCGPMAGLGG